MAAPEVAPSTETRVSYTFEDDEDEEDEEGTTDQKTTGTPPAPAAVVEDDTTKIESNGVSYDVTW